jgi:hypothetical protein
MVRSAAGGGGARGTMPRRSGFRRTVDRLAWAGSETWTLSQHAPHNAMIDPGEIGRFYDRGSDLMRELLDALAAAPDRPRTFPQIEDEIGWPRRRIASVLGGVSRLRQTEFGGRRPYRFQDERQSASGRWEMWMDAAQAQAVRAEQRNSRSTAATARSSLLRAAGGPVR